MTIIYDMANGRFQSLTTKKNATPVRDEVISPPALRLEEVSPAGTKIQPRAQTIQLIRALPRNS